MSPIDEVLEAVADADDFESLVDGLDGDRADDAVDAGAGPPPTTMPSLPRDESAIVKVPFARARLRPEKPNEEKPG